MQNLRYSLAVKEFPSTTPVISYSRLLPFEAGFDALPPESLPEISEAIARIALAGGLQPEDVIVSGYPIKDGKLMPLSEIDAVKMEAEGDSNTGHPDFADARHPLGQVYYGAPLLNVGAPSGEDNPVAYALKELSQGYGVLGVFSRKALKEAGVTVDEKPGANGHIRIITSGETLARLQIGALQLRRYGDGVDVEALATELSPDLAACIERQPNSNVDILADEGFGLTPEQKLSLIEHAKGYFEVTEQDFAQVRDSPHFRRVIFGLQEALDGMGLEHRADGLGITSVAVGSVAKDANGKVVSAMVTFKFKSLNANNEIESNTQKVEIRLEPDYRAVEVTERGGVRYIKVDADAGVQLPTTDKIKSDEGLYATFGGSSMRTVFARTETNIDDKQFDDERERGVWLTIPEIVEQADDLTAVVAALREAREEDAQLIAEALQRKLVSQQIEQPKPDNLRIRMAIGANLPKNTLEFVEATLRASRVMKKIDGDVVGVVMDALTLPNAEKPLLADVKAVVVRRNDSGGGSEFGIERVDNFQIREASVAAGVFKTDESSVIMRVALVSEIRAAAGGIGRQVTAGSTGDREADTSDEDVADDELQEEMGISSARVRVVLPGYRLSDRTTEIIKSYAIEDSQEEAKAGNVGGTGPRERAVTELVDVLTSDGNVGAAKGSPADAKTEFLAQLARLGVLQILREKQAGSR